MQEIHLSKFRELDPASIETIGYRKPGVIRGQTWVVTMKSGVSFVLHDSVTAAESVERMEDQMAHARRSEEHSSVFPVPAPQSYDRVGEQMFTDAVRDRQERDMAELRGAMAGMLAKLKFAHDEGPGAYTVVLTPDEAAVAYRLITKR